MRINTSSRYTYPIIVTGLFGILIGMVVITGWMRDIQVLKSILPNYVSMKFNSALCFVLISIALLLLNKYYHKGGHSLISILAITVLFIGILSISQELFGYYLGIDQIFFKDYDAIMASHPHPGRMSVLTAICFTSMGLAVLAIGKPQKKYKLSGQYLFHFVTIISFIIVVGYLYNIPAFYNLSAYTSTAFHSAMTFLFLSTAASLLNPSHGITKIFTGNLMGNIMARKLFSKMLIAVLLLGYVRMLLHKFNLVSGDLSIALLVVSFVFISLFFIWEKSTLLNRLELKMKTAEENFKISVEAAPYAMILFNQEGKILQANFQTEKLYGFNSSELMGQGVEILIPEKLQKHYKSVRESFLTSPGVGSLSIDESIYAIRKNGSKFPVEVLLTPISTPDGVVVLASVIDITNRKTNEDIINKQLIELQTKNQELEQFNYIASHDLQEPLRTVANYISLLEEDYPEQINDEIKVHLKSMDSAIARMSLLVKSLLDFSRLGRNKKLTLTDCTVVVNNVVDDLNGLIKKTGAKITIADDLPLLYAYETELRQLFQNLINNAIKFNKPGVTPNIKIGCEKVKGFYQFYVSDNGIGIEEKYYNDIFNIFQRLNKNEHYEGYGIGLANCRKITEMHGGEIWVESEIGKGSTFKFKILNFKAWTQKLTA